MLKQILPLFLSLIICTGILAQSNQSYWPKQMEVDGIVITIYGPELENFENNILDARSAFSIYDKSHLPVFGAMWFRCRVQTNVTKNEVYYTDIELVNASFPNATAENIAQFQQLIAQQAPSWQFNSNLQFFYKEASVLKDKNAYNEELKNNPPKIFYAKEPTVLIYIDGEPILANIPGSALYQYVVNTPHFIVKSSSDQQYYLKGGQWWYVASNPAGSWKSIETPPSFISKLASKAKEAELKTDGTGSSSSATQPKLLVTQEPAELIQTNGEPEIKQIYETLFSVSNSNDEIIFDASSDFYYILISGRWYKTKYLERGPWYFMEPQSLPVIFSEIPPTSAFAHIRLSVPGTPESMSAALDNGIPQTAIVDRKKAQMKIEYDGEPLFEAIPGTSLTYGVNTIGSVIADTSSRYYAVDQAIWFTSSTPNGPWLVADHFPQEIRQIPPSCPVFNMKFVHIYDYTEDIVYAGYTAGYLGAFLYHDVVYYGTGYKYKSWYGSTYIPRPSTYGNGAKKKSSKGINVSFYASSGPGYPMMGMGYGGYPYGYGYGYGWGMGYGYGMGMWNQAAYNQYYYAGQSVTIDHDLPEQKPIDVQNIYNNRSTGIIRTETAQRNDPMKPVLLKNSQPVPSDLYADDDGNLFKLDKQGNWYEQNGSEWRKINSDPRN